MKRYSTAAGMVLLISGQMASAGNLSTPEPVPAQPPIQAIEPAPMGYDWTGGYVGLQVGRLNLDIGNGGSGDDMSYGLHAGYDYDLGNFVLGGELEYDVGYFGAFQIPGFADVEDVARLKLRAGYDLGRTLVYATAGAARISTSIGSEVGPVGGIGVAYALSPHFTVGGEVLYQDFKRLGSTTTGADGTSLSLRASYRF